MKNKKILLGLTTTKGSNWREKVKEIDEFKIEEVALFLTGINKEQREELYALLEKSSLKCAPHVHLRDDIKKDEIDYLTKRYGTFLFNIHPIGHAKFRFNYDELAHVAEKIYIENTTMIPIQEELDKYGGLCIDFAHWESRKNIFEYKGLKELAEKNKIGCCHISAIKNLFGFFSRDLHLAKSKNDLNYIKKYQQYFPEIMSLELENSFKEQLEFKEYLENMLELK